MLIVIEGPDRFGKETQTKLLEAALGSYAVHGSVFVKHIEVPVKGSMTYTLIYWMLNNGLAKRFPNVFQVVQFMNKFMFQTFVLPKYTEFYDYVILDRWSLSGLVYGEATNVNNVLNRLLHRSLVKPDITLVMTGKPFPRTGEKDTYETDDQLQSRVSRLYVDYSRTLHGHTLVNNVGTKNEVHNRIMCILQHEGIIEQRWEMNK